MRYLCDGDLSGYRDHHQGRRKWSKSCAREYVDEGFSFLEIQLKHRRDVTVR